LVSSIEAKKLVPLGRVKVEGGVGIVMVTSTLARAAVTDLGKYPRLSAWDITDERN
jgi:hypothetical protein